ncbi:hypothetical protein RYX36_018187 [Vicia faba]
MEDQNHANELEIALRIVHVACALCGRVQEKFLATKVDNDLKRNDVHYDRSGRSKVLHSFEFLQTMPPKKSKKKICRKGYISINMKSLNLNSLNSNPLNLNLFHNEDGVKGSDNEDLSNEF